MSSIADSSTALAVMKTANADFLTFIENFKAFLGGTSDVTFTMGNYSVTVKSLLNLIKDYRDGVFTSLTIGGQSTGLQVTLSVDSVGRLKVSDTSGNLAYIECDTLSGAFVKDSTVLSVTATDCTVKNIRGTTSVQGGSVRLDSMELKSLSVGSLDTPMINTGILSVNNSLLCSGLVVLGSRRFLPKSTRNVFYEDNSPVDGVASAITVNTDGYWDMTTGSGTPATFGFMEGTVTYTGGVAVGGRLPGQVFIRGNNAYTDFVIGSVMMTNPTNILAYVSATGSGNFYKHVLAGGAGSYELAALALWPTGTYNTTEQGVGALYLSSFAAADIGNDVYYRTGASDWHIYRTMRIHYTSGSTIAFVAFEDKYRINRHSCVRFIAGMYSENEVYTGSMVTEYDLVYSLEIA